MSSKRRIAKYILPIILENRKPGQWYVEPFVGGANLIDKVEGNRMGNDIDHYLISLLKALQEGWCPPEDVSEKFYNKIKNNKESYPPELVGFVGFTCSYSGIWFNSYARSSDRWGIPRDHPKESYNNIMEQAPNLKSIRFTNLNYWEMQIPPNSIIYCDPPYQKTAKYKEQIKHSVFWQWCRVKGDEGHTVYISEYSAPDDFECLWEKEINSSLTKNTGAKKGIEKLFLSPPLSIL